VISPEFQDQLYKQHPCNYHSHRAEPRRAGRRRAQQPLLSAAKYLRQWRQEGVLQQERDSSLLRVPPDFTAGGVEFTRRGFLARVKLERFGEGKIYPHEETHASAQAGSPAAHAGHQMQPQPDLRLYPYPQNEAIELLAAATAGQAAADGHRSPRRGASPVAGQRSER